MTAETQGKTSNAIINQHQKQTTNKTLHSLKTGALSGTTDLAPSTTDLTKDANGRSVRTELLAHQFAQYLQQLPSIQNLLSHLERGGRSENVK